MRIKNYNIRLGIVYFVVLTVITGCVGQQQTDGKKTIKRNVILEGENVGGLKEKDIENKLILYSQKLNIHPRNAKLNEETWEIVDREKSGKKIDIDENMLMLLNADDGENKSLITEDVYPSITVKMLKNNISVIGSYTTPILDERDSRMNNIRLASERIDYEKIPPDEEFSFNNVLGKRTIKKGYEKAPIIIKTENGSRKSYGVGGGICQLASTLYNAVKNAGIKVTERHTHSKAVQYVPKGEDVAVSYGSADFKFVNDREYPIMIRVYLSNKQLTIELLENRN